MSFYEKNGGISKSLATASKKFLFFPDKWKKSEKASK